MRTTLSDEQDQLRQVARSFFERRAGDLDLRTAPETGAVHDPKTWLQLSEQLGVPGLMIPEAYGGSGYSFVELGLVLEESGRALLSSPLFGTSVLATSAVLACADEAAPRELLPTIADGSVLATLAVSESTAARDGIGEIAATACQKDGRWYLSGNKTLVVDGDTADLLLVLARADGRLSLFAVAEPTGVQRTALPVFDRSRPLATVSFSDTPARLLGGVGDGDRVLEQVMNHAAAALAVEAVGGAQWCLDETVAYAKTREQFGKPIGTNQAIKHKAADMLLAVESARSAAYHALWTVGTDPAQAATAAALAKSHCTDAFFSVAAEAVQIHGGIGFTWEHPVQLYFKRAKASQLLLGSPAHHRESLAVRMKM